jgi:hypothetical protein
MESRRGVPSALTGDVERVTDVVWDHGPEKIHAVANERAHFLEPEHHGAFGLILGAKAKCQATHQTSLSGRGMESLNSRRQTIPLLNVVLQEPDRCRDRLCLRRVPPANVTGACPVGVTLEHRERLGSPSASSDSKNQKQRDRKP